VSISKEVAMSDCIFKNRITVKPSSHEFWPAGGWHVKGKGWARFYACQDKGIVRRAVVEPSADGWKFRVSEITRYSVFAVAVQPPCVKASQVTQCTHAADLAACGARYMEVAHG
jgi:hypothetical protein